MRAGSAPPGAVGVIGGGRMGAGIAQPFAAAGSSVVVVEQDDTAAAAGLDRIAAGLRRAAEREGLGGPASDADPAGGTAVSCVSSVAELPHDAQLVVEAVPEDAALEAKGARRRRTGGGGGVPPGDQHQLAVGDTNCSVWNGSTAPRGPRWGRVSRETTATG